MSLDTGRAAFAAGIHRMNIETGWLAKVATEAALRADLPGGRPGGAGAARAEVTEVRALARGDARRAALDAHLAARGARNMRVFLCRFADGAWDVVALRLRAGVSDAHAAEALRRFWPRLRARNVAGDAPRQDPRRAAEAAIRAHVRDDMRCALAAMDGGRRLLQANAAARDLLARGGGLRLAGGRLQAARPGLDRDLARAVRRLAAGEEDAAFLAIPDEAEGRGDGGAAPAMLPVSLTVAGPRVGGRRVVLAAVALAPRAEQLRRAALARGLTPTEARVAARLAAGLSNREAAAALGLKEQTLQTYAKRIFAKMGVSCRARLAHELTWQAMGAGL
ncbi:regulatory protein, luxR family [Oceanicella actignis]|uniref:Regulatory protein, luxR family n=2 Tax=Oceanicella actignis TaxID=1189325 RepID=A0A1M7SPK4_9RHOB|nr:regulatory protein, luxR family [Oceanicella actignis]SHN60431.1 regulatory protein, luxR family [Oceanicella actignis]